MDHPRPGLRYVDAGDLDDSKIDFDSVRVESNAGEKLGDVDGFIIDLGSARPYYVVVDAGGWFRSKFFLLPIGHVGLDASGNRLVADISRDRVARYPGFDRDEFETLSDEELTDMDEEMLIVCCPDEAEDPALSSQRYDQRTHYRSPSWWDSSFYRPDRADAAARSMASTGSSATTMPSRDEVRSQRDRSRKM